MSEREFENFKLTFHPAAIPVLKSVLEDEGIEYFMQGENFTSLYPSIPFLSGLRLHVAKEDAPRVQQILDQLAEKAPELGEDPGGEL